MIWHILAIHDPLKSWCGEVLAPGDGCFKSVDAAVLNGLHFTETESCHNCINIIIETLRKAQAGRIFK